MSVNGMGVCDIYRVSGEAFPPMVEDPPRFWKWFPALLFEDGLGFDASPFDWKCIGEIVGVSPWPSENFFSKDFFKA